MKHGAQQVMERIMMEDRTDNEDYNVDDVLYVLSNPQKKDNRCTNIADAVPTLSRIRYT